MANSVQIKYQGEVLCCLDQTEVKAVEPYVYFNPPIRNVFQRIADWTYRFVTGKRTKVMVGEGSSSCDTGTKVLFKDGTWMRIKMPFMEFIDEYS